MIVFKVLLLNGFNSIRSHRYVFKLLIIIDYMEKNTLWIMVIVVLIVAGIAASLVINNSLNNSTDDGNNTGTGEDTGSTYNGDSGIYGKALIGPTCPVVKTNSNCSDRPYQGEIIVMQNGKEVKRFSSNRTGNFNIKLAPGSYTLSSNTGLPFLKPVEVVVYSDKLTEVNLSFDSGIR